MNHTLKYILIYVEAFAMLLCFIFGIAAASSGAFFLGLICIIAPFVYGNLVNFAGHLDYIEVYERAWNIKLQK